jgi:hypothetical protein
MQIKRTFYQIKYLKCFEFEIKLKKATFVFVSLSTFVEQF